MNGTVVRTEERRTGYGPPIVHIGEPPAGVWPGETGRPSLGAGAPPIMDRPEPALVWPGHAASATDMVWPLVADLRDSDGSYLTAVEVTSPPKDGVWPLGRVDEPSVLLRYMFGQGQRTVMLDLGMQHVIGCLATHWDGGHRTWWLEPDADPVAAST